MRKIQVMNETLANKIAAGEIIERPLSVIKELVENAIDAGASKIKIDLIESGVSKIVINDNGIGMNSENLKLCTKRHATSKVYDDVELFKIATLGFRGEALASIFAVSQMQIASKTATDDGNILIKQADETFEIKPHVMNQSTEITVENLFYNTPVRFKHLANPYYELSLIVNYINKLALTMPEISFIVTNNDKELINTYGNGDVIHTISKVYSNNIAKGMINLDIKSDNFEVTGYFSGPDHTRSKRNFITISINKRIIKNFQIEQAIIEGFGHFLHTNQYPIAVINIEVDYSLVDVNIHPTKQQVKISMLEELQQMITKEIHEQLQQLLFIPVANLNETIDGISDVASEPSIKKDNEILSDVIKDEKRFELHNEFQEIAPQKEIKKKYDLFEEENVVNQSPRLPKMEYIGTLHNTYLLFQNETGMYLLDQHAAQERINYELIYHKFTERTFNFQQLLIPLIIELTTDEFLLIKDKLEEFEEIGIKLLEFGINTLKVEEVDNFYLKSGNLELDIQMMLKKIIQQPKLDFAKIYEDLAIMMACKSSIKANQYINRDEIDSLIEQLNTCVSPYTCPHGRPVIVNITTKDIEKMFKRTFN